jgi:hypothetical protein
MELLVGLADADLNGNFQLPKAPSGAPNFACREDGCVRGGHFWPLDPFENLWNWKKTGSKTIAPG